MQGWSTADAVSLGNADGCRKCPATSSPGSATPLVACALPNHSICQLDNSVTAPVSLSGESLNPVLGCSISSKALSHQNINRQRNRKLSASAEFQQTKPKILIDETLFLD